MKVYIDDKTRFVFVLTDDVRMAFALGHRFDGDNPDLKAVGWTLCCCPRAHKLLGEYLYREEAVDGLATLAQAIRKGPPCSHSCPRHPPAGPEGYQVVG